MDTIKICCAGGPGVHTADCQYYEKRQPKQKLCPGCEADIDDSQSYCSDNCRADYFEPRYDHALRVLKQHILHQDDQEVQAAAMDYDEQARIHELLRKELQSVQSEIERYGA